MSNTDDSVRVALRIRPMVKSEVDRGCQEVVSRVADEPQVIVTGIESFTFNYVFGVDDKQEQVYTEAVSEMLNRLFDGINVTILAYGQTGSGKTHTMGSAFDGEMDEHVGVIPRAMNDIFDRIEQLTADYHFRVTCSFMELYQEMLIDLLSSRSRECSVLEIRENENGIFIQNLTELSVRSSRETTDCLLRGSSGRTVGSTAMNQQSSRSHAIFTVNIEATKKNDTKSVTRSKFHLVDLAGSERSKKTMATGDRFKEGVKINQGLLVLGNVISTLGMGNGSCFVPYRDSKLTRLLQDSLGGNAVTLMIACVSPADYNVKETMNTLRYANRARKIKNKPIVNQDPHAAEINRLNGVITQLQMEIVMLGGTMHPHAVVPAINGNGCGGSDSSDDGATLPAGYCKLCKQNMEQTENYQLQQHVALCEVQAHIAEAVLDKLRAKTVLLRSGVAELLRAFASNAGHDQMFKHVEQIASIINNMDEEMERFHSKVQEQDQGRISLSEGVAVDDDVPDKEASLHLEAHMLVQEEADTSKKKDFKEQPRRTDCELQLKEKLHQSVAGNYDKLGQTDKNVEERLQQYASNIQKLEAQNVTLLDKLVHFKASAKLAEERRMRLHVLEQELNDYKRRSKQQERLFKELEKDKLKINNLNSVIQAMKESNVKRIRAMRHESDHFRQWKLASEGELMQLRNKNRKMRNEMSRKGEMYTKQLNVVKRKYETTLAHNKRLQDALERQGAAQAKRQKLANKKGCSSCRWIDRELEVIVSVIDAKQSLDQLMENRDAVSRRLAMFNSSMPSSPPSGPITDLERCSAQDELEMLNAQITELEQKVCVADLDKRIRSLGESVQSVGEARIILQHLVQSILGMRREHAENLQNHKAALGEQLMRQQNIENRYATATIAARQLDGDHYKTIADLDRTSEDKVDTIHNKKQMGILLPIRSN